MVVPCAVSGASGQGSYSGCMAYSIAGVFLGKEKGPFGKWSNKVRPCKRMLYNYTICLQGIS